MHDAIVMDTPVDQRLLDGCFQEGRGILLVELQNPHEFLHPTALRPSLPQAAQEPVVGLRPALTPASEGFRMLEGPRTLFQQGQVMERIEDILLAVIAAWMPR